MEGFDPATYGDSFADVYDDWYGRISDVEATVDVITDLAGGGPVLELGIGTGRIAIPLAERGVEVAGIDASDAMVDRLRAKSGGEAIPVRLGDMADVEPPVDGPFAVVFVAYNTLFNLVTAEAQQRCLARAAARLAPGGAFVVEAFVPSDGGDEGRGPVDVRAIEIDRVVLSLSQRDSATQTVVGQYVELSGAAVRLRPWMIRYAYPAELDGMAERAGLTLECRWAGWDRSPFADHSPAHVSVYRRPRDG